jgi:hypothetical protein
LCVNLRSTSQCWTSLPENRDDPNLIYFFNIHRFLTEIKRVENNEDHALLNRKCTNQTFSFARKTSTMSRHATPRRIVPSPDFFVGARDLTAVGSPS